MSQRLSQDIDNVIYSDIPGMAGLRNSSRRMVLGMRLDSNVRNAVPPYMARIHACVHSGNINTAIELSEQYIASGAYEGVNVTSRDHAVYACILAEVFLLNDDSMRGATYARVGIEGGQETADAAISFWATSLYAAAKASAGELTDAARDSMRALEVAKQHQWAVPWPLSFAMKRVATRQQNALMAVPDIVTTATHRDDFLTQGIRNLETAVDLLREHRYPELIGLVEEMVFGIESRLLPPLIRDNAVLLGCLAFLQTGSFSEVMLAVKDLVSPSGHAVCYQLLRASVFINGGDPRAALQVTEQCVALDSEHCLGPFASVLVRRAIANEMLGNHSEADRLFSRASHIGMRIGAVSPVVGLPMDIVETLYWRLMDNEPEFGREIQKILPPKNRYRGSSPEKSSVTSLTQREKTVAYYLTTAMTLEEIAQQLYLSVNTVKTQVKSIYRKLDVSTRAAAVETLYRDRWLLHDTVGKQIRIEESRGGGGVIIASYLEPQQACDCGRGVE